VEEASQGWASWAWSFVPQITADSEVTEFAESGHQQSAKKVEQSVFDVGVYIMQASVVFKVCMCTGCNIVSRMCTPSPSPPVDIVRAMMIVWRIRRKLIRTVLCCVVSLYAAVVHSDMHTHEQFLKDECWFRFRFSFCEFV